MCELSVSAELTDGWGEAKQRLCVQRAGSGTICVLWVQKSRVWHRLCVLGLFSPAGLSGCCRLIGGFFSWLIELLGFYFTFNL
jgi:hypothetical protein